MGCIPRSRIAEISKTIIRVHVRHLKEALRCCWRSDDLGTPPPPGPRPRELFLGKRGCKAFLLGMR